MEDIAQGLQLTALDPTYRANPYPRLRQAREECPVRRDAFFGAVQLTRYADVRGVLTDRTLWRDPMRADDTSLAKRRAVETGESREGVQSILTSDDPDHARVRGLLTPVLYKRFNESRSMVDRVVERRLDALAGRETFDLIDTFAMPIPIEVIAHMLGVDESRLIEFRAWSEAIIQTFNPARNADQTAAMMAGSEASVAYITELMAMRRVAPKDDLVSDLVAMKDGGADISDDEIKVNCLTLLIAGNLTTTDLIGNGVRLFLTHPDQLAKLMADPSLIGAAVEEVLRYEPPVDQTGRVASRDLEIGGCPVKAREQLSPSLRSANRDPDVFPDPDAFDITRARAPHVAFGGGAHICLGAPLARIEAQSAFLGLFRRFPNLALVDVAPRWRSLPFFRGLERLEVTTG
jgi:cytochrome P450